MGAWLRALAALFSAPFCYSRVNSNEARVPTNLCLVVFRLGVVRMYVKGLLSIFTTKGACT